MKTLIGCYCGCTLRDGTRAIGILYIVASLFAFIRTVYYYTTVPTTFDSNDTIALFAIGITLLIGFFIVEVFLLLAVSKKKPVYLLPWLTINAIKIIGTLIASIYVFATLWDWNKDALLDFFVICRFSLILVVEVYFWLVVYSYYTKLNSTEVSEFLDKKIHA